MVRDAISHFFIADEAKNAKSVVSDFISNATTDIIRNKEGLYNALLCAKSGVRSPQDDNTPPKSST